MDLSDQFIATSATVGLVPMLTQYFMLVATFAFAGMFVFSITAQNRVHPDHRAETVIGAIICGVAGLSYFLIYSKYSAMLGSLAHLGTDAERSALMLKSYSAIGQFRYMDWMITTPLLLTEICLVLRIKPREMKKSLAILIIADILMILTGYIGEQQLTATGAIMQTAKGNWGLLSTLFYLAIPIVLYTQIGKFKSQATPEERCAFKVAAATTWTTWGIYPLGYAFTTFFESFDPNLIHIVFTIADVVNKVGVGVVLYLAAAAAINSRPSQKPGFAN